MKCSFEMNNRGYLKQRESFDIEFKQSFQFGDSLAMYMKSIVGMANNKEVKSFLVYKIAPEIRLV